MLGIKDIERVKKIQVEMDKRSMEQPDWAQIVEVLDITDWSESKIDAYCQNLWKVGLSQRIYTDILNTFLQN